jgi:predicted RNA binding protein YcfA (HicA-like mRNA interferase family)
MVRFLKNSTLEGFCKKLKRERIVIPIHGNRPLKIGLLRAQMKIADLSESEI